MAGNGNWGQHSAGGTSQARAAKETDLVCRAPGRNGSHRHVCATKLGEAPLSLRFMGVVRRWNDRTAVLESPRDVRRCPKCGWFNLYEPLSEAGHPNGGSRHV